MADEETTEAALAEIEATLDETVIAWVHTTYRDPSNDYAGSVEQQAATGMAGAAPGNWVE